MEIVIMKMNKIVCAVLIIAAGCFLSDTFNHIVSTGKGWLSPLLLTCGCLCGAFVFFEKKE